MSTLHFVIVTEWMTSNSDFVFWATVCKTVHAMLSDRCLSCLSVCPFCNIGVLWTNGLMDQDETWHAGRRRPRPHCVRWEPSSPSKGHSPSPQFSAHICCGQKSAWIKMPLDMEVGLGSGRVVLHRDPALAHPPPKKMGIAPNFLLMSIVAKQLDGSTCRLHHLQELISS